MELDNNYKKVENMNNLNNAKVNETEGSFKSISMHVENNKNHIIVEQAQEKDLFNENIPTIAFAIDTKTFNNIGTLEERNACGEYNAEFEKTANVEQRKNRQKRANKFNNRNINQEK